MSETSKIEWTRSTFNPWIGCTKVSPGCDYCYAEVSTPARSMKIHWGAGQQRHRIAPANWNQVCKWSAKAAETGEFWRVFTGSLADIFDNEVPDEWRSGFSALARDCPHLTLQVLTKRIGNAPRMPPADWGSGYPNVWLGISVIDQEEADGDIPKLLTTPAAVRWLSMEPLLGPVDIRLSHARHARHALSAVNYPTGKPFVDWVVVGGESGNQARPMHPDWARYLRDQCAAAGVPFLFKQWGEWTPEDPGEEIREFDCAGVLPDGDAKFYSQGYVAPFDYGGRLAAAGNVRLDGRTLMHRVGKKTAGRLLDGIQHDGYPVARVA
jgi:protein gp37